MAGREPSAGSIYDWAKRISLAIVGVRRMWAGTTWGPATPLVPAAPATVRSFVFSGMQRADLYILNDGAAALSAQFSPEVQGQIVPGPDGPTVVAALGAGHVTWWGDCDVLHLQLWAPGGATTYQGACVIGG